MNQILQIWNPDLLVQVVMVTFGNIFTPSNHLKQSNLIPQITFQLQVTESGNAIIEKRIGLEIIKIAKIKFQFLIKLIVKKANKNLDFTDFEN